jgi:hypothetical protein
MNKKGNQDLIARILATKQIKVSWIYEDEAGFLYKNVDGSIVSNPKTQSLRFELKEKNGDDYNFEVIIRKVKDSYFLKIDYPEMEGRNYPLKIYVSPDEIVLYFEDAYNRAYFHLD